MCFIHKSIKTIWLDHVWLLWEIWGNGSLVEVAFSITQIGSCFQNHFLEPIHFLKELTNHSHLTHPSPPKTEKSNPSIQTDPRRKALWTSCLVPISTLLHHPLEPQSWQWNYPQLLFMLQEIRRLTTVGMVLKPSLVNHGDKLPFPQLVSRISAINRTTKSSEVRAGRYPEIFNVQRTGGVIFWYGKNCWSFLNADLLEGS